MKCTVLGFETLVIWKSHISSITIISFKKKNHGIIYEKIPELFSENVLCQQIQTWRLFLLVKLTTLFFQINIKQDWTCCSLLRCRLRLNFLNTDCAMHFWALLSIFEHFWALLSIAEYCQGLLRIVEHCWALLTTN